MAAATYFISPTGAIQTGRCYNFPLADVRQRDVPNRLRGHILMMDGTYTTAAHGSLHSQKPAPRATSITVRAQNQRVALDRRGSVTVLTIMIAPMSRWTASASTPPTTTPARPILQRLSNHKSNHITCGTFLYHNNRYITRR